MKKWIVGKENTLKRLDLFLSEQLETMSRKILQQAIKEEKVTVNKKPAQKKYLLQEADVVILDDTWLQQCRKIRPNSTIPVMVYYADEHIVVAEKPGRIPTQPLSNTENSTLLNGLIALYPDIQDIGEGGCMSGIVHRLDKETSGVLVVSRTDSAYSHLREQFSEKTVKRTYTVLVKGAIQKTACLIDEIAHHVKNKKKMIVVESPKNSFRGKKLYAELSYCPLEYYTDYTLLEIQLLTGVMHQIRVQCAHAGFPVAGDSLYGEIDESFPRHFVHAHKLGFYHPETEKWIEFTSPLPDDLRQILSRLKKK